MKRLYFMRHGETEMNVQNIWSGTTETPLTSKGREQAKKAGKKAKTFGIDYIVSSPLSRAHETAKLIAKEIGYPADKIHTNSLFIERHFGEIEGTVWDFDTDLDGIIDIETFNETLERSRLALQWLHGLDAQNILVVSHGSFGRALRHHILEDYPYTNRRSDQINRIHNAQIERWL
ncbi:hypothetical protein A3D14_02125 [Candidatus Saccharibacteria bacterium RIFCSPHIGHO2_02_FULL_47_12]|nr:MAG: hypothetical protein A3D14_02125 [Candidatus Saccharibacteria bacterium RIFCSPHIGHO2_02_FULL_47_12]